MIEFSPLSFRDITSPLNCFVFPVQVSAFLEIHDIAGLVRGAHEGQGLGNSFLSHIRAVDGIFHVLSEFLSFFLLFLLEMGIVIEIIIFLDPRFIQF